MVISEKLLKNKKNNSNYGEKELKAAFAKMGFEEFLVKLRQEE